MPGGDRTGPRGEGPRTGWGMGFCGRPGEEGKEGQVGGGPLQRFWRWGRGFGRGWGFGRGRWFGWGRGRGPGRGWGMGRGARGGL